LCKYFFPPYHFLERKREGSYNLASTKLFVSPDDLSLYWSGYISGVGAVCKLATNSSTAVCSSYTSSLLPAALTPIDQSNIVYVHKTSDVIIRK
jgi:hypothetical protein